MKSGVNFYTHPQPLKFGNGHVISSHISLGMWLRIHAGIKVLVNVSQSGPRVTWQGCNRDRPQYYLSLVVNSGNSDLDTHSDTYSTVPKYSKLYLRTLGNKPRGTLPQLRKTFDWAQYLWVVSPSYLQQVVLL